MSLEAMSKSRKALPIGSGGMAFSSAKLKASALTRGEHRHGASLVVMVGRARALGCGGLR